MLIVGSWLVWPSKISDGRRVTGSVQSSIRVDAESRSGSKALRSVPETFKLRSRFDQASGADRYTEAERRIERVLLDDSFSNTEAAKHLRDIAAMSDLSNQIRMDALGHGILLDPSVMIHLTSDPDLPETMALEILNHMVNFNEQPSIQIRVYGDLLKHSSAEVRDQAREMLRFLTEDDQADLSDVDLLRAAERVRHKLGEVESSLDRK